MTRSPDTPFTLGVVGVPGERRVRLLVEAAERARAHGREVRVEVIGWHDVLTAFEAGTTPALPRLDALRIDSSGEDPSVEARLRALGGFDRSLGHGEVGGWAEWSTGLVAATRWLLEGPASGVPASTTASDLADLFDKRATRRRLLAAGVPVPGVGVDVGAVCDAPGRWFLKASHGSSGSGVIALAVGRDRVEAWAPMVLDDGVPFNDFAVARRTGDEARALVAALAARGPVHVERWFPKATLDGFALDLRVVVIDGEARNVVARGSRSPLTNLHLGNRRVDVAAVRDRAGALWETAMRTAEAAAAAFGDTRCVGVDVLLSSRWNTCVVGEVNAFGDLLPGALHEGRDTYDWQLLGLAAPKPSAQRDRITP